MRLIRKHRNTLSHVEREGLRTPINLADGHVRRQPTPAEKPILDSLQEIYNLSLKCNPLELERQFVTSYLGLSGQKLPPHVQPYIFFSASEVIGVVGRILAKHGETCAILEPTFDNIPLLMDASNIPLVSFPEGLLLDTKELAKATHNASAIFVTLPNNPTGLVLDQAAFKKLCDFCAESGKALVIDACFRLYVPTASFNYYQILSDSGVDWMVIEDTGKVWATNDLKAGILICSDKYAQEADNAFHDVVFSISPFALALLWRLSEQAGLGAIKEIRATIQHNRRIIRSALSASKIFRPGEDTKLPMQNVYYDQTLFPNQQNLIKKLHSQGLGVLGSEAFYWASGKHEPFLRLCLSRDPALVSVGVEVLTKFGEEFPPDSSNVQTFVA